MAWAGWGFGDTSGTYLEIVLELVVQYRFASEDTFWDLPSSYVAFGGLVSRWDYVGMWLLALISPLLFPGFGFRHAGFRTEAGQGRSEDLIADSLGGVGEFTIPCVKS